MASTLTKLSDHRQNSRPASLTSTSILNGGQPTTLNARNGSGHQSPATGLRAKSPNENVPMASYFSSRQFSPEHSKRISSETNRRSSALYMRPESKNGLTDGTANVNGWSKSTGSSKRTSGPFHHRKSSFSKRLSGSIGSFGAFNHELQGPTSNAKCKDRSRSPPAIAATESGVSPPSENPPNLLAPIVTLSSLSSAVEATDSSSSAAPYIPATGELLSPSSNRTYEQDCSGSQSTASPPSDLRLRNKGPATDTPSRASPIFSQNTDSSHTKVPESVYSPRATSFAKSEPRRHSAHRRRRTSSAKSSGTPEAESSASENRDIARRSRRRRAPSQKALLSKALAKANHAVVLDGKQDVEVAILAYGDACNLLRQVMIRSSGEDDRRKLEAVRNTYKNRIRELQHNDPLYGAADNKPLPGRPPERDSAQPGLATVTDEDGESAEEPRKSIPMGHHDSGYGSGRYKYTQSGSHPYLSPHRQSLHSSTFQSDSQDMSANRYGDSGLNGNHLYHLQAPIYEEDMPPPLSPRRPSSPAPPAQRQFTDDDSEPEKEVDEQHTSWLNTINESEGSSASSVHSRRSSVGLRRRQIRAGSGATEAEFAAALDAAIETAYDDGFEPDDEAEDEVEALHEVQYRKEPPRRFSAIRRDIQSAKDNVREIEREAAITEARKREKERLQGISGRPNSLQEEFGNEGDEEERLLEEMTRDFILGDAEYDVQTKSALPRQSDASGFLGRTWGSFGSIPTSAGTSLSPAAEGRTLLSLASQLQKEQLPPLVHPPPSGALPPPPAPLTLNTPQAEDTSRRTSLSMHSNFTKRTPSPSVRERRLSGMKAKELKIETNSQSYASVTEAPKTQPPPIPVPMVSPQIIPEAPASAFSTGESQQAPASSTIKDYPDYPPRSATFLPERKISFPLTGLDGGEPVSSTASALTKVTSADSDTLATSLPSSPAHIPTKTATGLRKNFSSSSLRSKSFNATDHDTSPNTSVSSISSAPKTRRLPSPAMPVMPTSVDASFLPKGQPIGGSHLFECDMHLPLTPGSLNPLASNAPLPLEPCPDSPMLRPFWFLRTIFQTIAHPRGGYITSRLFIPRDIWRVKNIKLKHVEEKVSTCDLLTAALLKLGKVETLNADAVLEEMQIFENFMERAQANLSKKLGSEVGVQGALAAFKGVNITDENASNSEATNSTSLNANKSYLKGWRKLRSKNSVGHHVTANNLVNASKHDLKDVSPSMNSLPMTNAQNPRFPKRDVSQVQCVGPNPSYMGALARLCDAAQILDQIARQVEDPGLKHSSPTHVGLELCTRHAAEFFDFYICRFVLADIGLMLDKFIKRSSEWVLA